MNKDKSKIFSDSLGIKKTKNKNSQYKKVTNRVKVSGDNRGSVVSYVGGLPCVCDKCPDHFLFRVFRRVK